STTKIYTLSLHDALPIYDRAIGRARRLEMSERHLMSLKGKLEAIIYAAEEPVTVDQLAGVLKEAGLVQQLLAPESGEGEESLARSEEHTSELQSRGHLVC